MLNLRTITGRISSFERNTPSLLGSAIEITAAQDETTLIKRKKKSQFYNNITSLVLSFYLYSLLLMPFGYITDNQSYKSENSKALKQVRQKQILEL